MSSAHEQRILVTGYLPQTPPGELYDVVDIIGEACALPDATWHMDNRMNRGKLDRLQTMSSYVASVSLRDLEPVLPTATHVIVFDSSRNWTIGLRAHRARQVASVVEHAEDLEIPALVLHDFDDARRFAGRLAAQH